MRNIPHNPQKHRRCSIRLPGYDYASPGAYFVTICVRSGECLLGDIVDGEMRLNDAGQIADDFWAQVPDHFPNVSIDAFTTMPNHLHTIIVIQAQGGGTPPLHHTHSKDDACRGAGSPPRHHTHSKDDACRGAGSPPRHQVHSRNDAGRGVETAPSEVSPSKPSSIERPTLGQIVAYYKHETTKHINRLRNMPGVPFWQRNYWEHIIRNDHSLQRIQSYIENNPALWEKDQLHPSAPPNPFNQWPSPP